MIRRIFNITLDFLNDPVSANISSNIQKICERSRKRRKERKLIILHKNYRNNILKKVIYKIRNYNEVIEKFSEETFFSHFRMSKLAFEKHFSVLAPFWDVRGGPATGLKECLHITIWALANQNSFRELSDRFNKSKSTIYCIVLKICKLLRKISHIYIKWPHTSIQIEEIVNDFNNLRSRGFPNVVGCIDGMHISIQAPNCDPSSYYNRKGQYSMVLQVYPAVCKSDLSFSNVFFGWPGRSHDAYVFESSELGKELIEGKIQLPQDIHIVGDSAYPLRTYLMVPFKDNGILTTAQKYYNTELSSTRIIIEQAFRRLKCKFRILENIKFNKLSTVKDIVLACTILHNFIILEDTESIFTDDIESVGIDVNNDREPMQDNTGLEEAKNKRNSICHLISSSYN